MLETNIYGYFAFGYNYFILRDGSVGRKVRGEWECTLGDSLEVLLDEFFEHLESLNLQVTLQAANDLRNVRKKISSMSEEARVDSDLATKVTQACEKLDVTLDSELKLRTAFVVTPGRFSTEYLLEKPWDLLGGETLPRLPDIALFDFIAACRALALGLRRQPRSISCVAWKQCLGSTTAA